MRLRAARTLILSCAALAACGGPAATQPQPVHGAPGGGAAAGAAGNGTAEPGFVPLFNGRDLEGWTGDTAGYLAQDGAIVCGPGGTNLYSKGEWADFELRLRFRLTPGANNGIGIRAPLAGDAAYEGLEIQVLDDGHEKYRGWLKPWQRHGSVYGISASTGSTEALRPAGEWNDEAIVARGRRITVTLNGRVIQDVDLDAATAAGTLSGKDHPGIRRTSGHVAFLGHGDRVEYRDIRIRTIEPGPAPANR